jgi:starch-binding outer membrane protein, SusD/RagB family
MKITKSKIINRLAHHFTILIIGFQFIFSSCKKFVEVPPPYTQLSSANVFSDDATATAAMFAIFSQLGSDAVTYNLSLYPGLSADEFTNYSSDQPNIQLYDNSITADNSLVSELWNKLYNLIFQCNSIIESLDKSSNLSPAVKQQIYGEALFMRGWLYFYLENNFGDIPLITSTDYTKNSTLSRSPSEAIYEQIIKDLIQSQTMLSTYFVDANSTTSSEERLRPTTWAARALLSRVYLYIGKWEEAIEHSSSVIINSGLFALSDSLNEVFLMNSHEAIWQITISPYNTVEGPRFTLTSIPSISALSPQLINSFEDGDRRLKNWVGQYTEDNQTYYFPSKYKVFDFQSPITEYIMVIRLAELYLIRAEAYAQIGSLSQSLDDINKIRLRAGLSPFTSSSKEYILSKIQQERKIELFSELGHRWFDLKRTNKIDEVMSKIAPEKGGNWNNHARIYPIPQSDRLKNPNLTQNPGY